MKHIVFILAALFLGLSACSGPKTYFSNAVRNRLESKSISMEQLQFYVDRDVELRRELASGEASVIAGKVKFENGKYIHIVMLRSLTPGVCTGGKSGELQISFEDGDGKVLTFGVVNANDPNEIYQIFADEWIKRNNAFQNAIGRVKYDGQEYMIQPGGVGARLMIQKSVVNRLNVDRRVMKGRKVD